jgi:hypothetical protein
MLDVFATNVGGAIACDPTLRGLYKSFIDALNEDLRERRGETPKNARTATAKGAIAALFEKSLDGLLAGFLRDCQWLKSLI